MKLVHEEVLFAPAGSMQTAFIAEALADVRKAITNVVWPPKARSFSIRPVVDGNGVLPIKIGFVQKLRKLGWKLESRPTLASGLGPGKIDALKHSPDGRVFAAEWETGNISSSHRALNKLCMGMIEGQLAGGVLVLPDRDLYCYLTQRIGNYRELSPYFPVYRRMKAINGVLAVFAVSFDQTSPDTPIIPKGMDGNSLLRRALLGP